MAEKGFFERFKEQVSSPWDWVAAGVGGTGGLVASIFMHGADMGTSAGAGALGAVTLRQAGAAALRKRTLRKRAKRLLRRMAARSELTVLCVELQRDLDLLDDDVLTPDKFALLLEEHIERFRQIH